MSADKQISQPVEGENKLGFGSEAHGNLATVDRLALLKEGSQKMAANDKGGANQEMPFGCATIPWMPQCQIVDNLKVPDAKTQQGGDQPPAPAEKK